LSWDNPVSIVTTLRLDDRDSMPGRGRVFYNRHRVRTGWGPSSLLSNGYRSLLPGSQSIFYRG